ncbi:hypothetical protein [Vibrio parahaemolyticus]|uniref:hypothetical protein n=1 Tax=Vibrio parahaemolyticus TaxID=670 RepID=UPI0023EC6FE9|nr:hypothetical protein [Vibrio parahaemolyticus]
MKSKPANFINSKKLVLTASIASFASGVEGSNLTEAIFFVNTSSVVFLVLMIALTGLSLYQPEKVKGVMSLASVTLCVPLVVLSVIRPVMGDAVEPMWSVLCIGVMTTLFIQIVADTRLVLPQVKAVLSYK